MTARHPAVASLFMHLIDDAAVFPPGNALLPDAIAAHRRHRTSSYAVTVGPLLVPVGWVPELVALVGEDPVAATLIARPGTADEIVEQGVALALAAEHVRVTGIELPWSPHWRTLALGELPLALELSREIPLETALDDLARARGSGRAVVAKFRTGATPSWGWPNENELALVITGALERGLPFKLTGGMHHFLRAEHGGEPQHGLLNVLAATAVALADPTRSDEVAAALAERDPLALVPIVESWSTATAADVRRAFTAYGCCEVTDPLGELVDMGLLPHDLSSDLRR